MTEDEARNLYPLALKLEARALTIRYLRERDENLSRAVLRANEATWEKKKDAMVKARADYIAAQTGLGWVKFYDKAKAKGY